MRIRVLRALIQLMTAGPDGRQVKLPMQTTLVHISVITVSIQGTILQVSIHVPELEALADLPVIVPGSHSIRLTILPLETLWPR